jgi:hypothetical protein
MKHTVTRTVTHTVTTSTRREWRVYEAVQVGIGILTLLATLATVVLAM